MRAGIIEARRCWSASLCWCGAPFFHLFFRLPAPKLAGWLAGAGWVAVYSVFIAANILVTSPSHHRAVLHLLHCRCQLMGPCQVEALLFQDLIENIPACVFGGILVKVRPQGARINLAPLLLLLLIHYRLSIVDYRLLLIVDNC